MTHEKTPNTSVITQDILAQWRDKPGALLPILHGIQNAIGYIPETSVPMIAKALQQTRADVHGVISFYEDFRTRPGGRYRLQICRAEACQARGCQALEDYTRQKLSVDYGQTTADGEITLDPVYCLGNCATGPSVRVGDRILGRVSAARMDRLIDELTTVPLEIHSGVSRSQTGSDDSGRQGAVVNE